MLGYYDPESLQVEETEAAITFISAADHQDKTRVHVKTRSELKRVADGLTDQALHGIAGTDGRVRKVQGTFSRVKGSLRDGIITDAMSRKQTPVRLTFRADGSLPSTGLCIALGEMVDGALMVSKMTVAPMGTVPLPLHGPQ